MSQATIYTNTGKKQGASDLPKEIFAVAASDELLAQAVYVHLSNRRQAGARTLRRADVALTTQKMHRQKGTGRARHGAKSAPIFVGGGIAHGPDGSQNYSKTMPKKMRRRAMLGALSRHAERNTVMILQNMKIENTKSAAELLKKIALEHSSILIILPVASKAETAKWRNISSVDVTYAETLHAYDILSHDVILLANGTIEAIEATYLQSSANSLKATQKVTTKTKEVTPSTKKKSAGEKTSELKAESKKKSTSKKSTATKTKTTTKKTIKK